MINRSGGVCPPFDNAASREVLSRLTGQPAKPVPSTITLEAVLQQFLPNVEDARRRGMTWAEIKVALAPVLDAHENSWCRSFTKLKRSTNSNLQPVVKKPRSVRSKENGVYQPVARGAEGPSSTSTTADEQEFKNAFVIPRKDFVYGGKRYE